MGRGWREDFGVVPYGTVFCGTASCANAFWTVFGQWLGKTVMPEKQQTPLVFRIAGFQIGCRGWI